MRWTFAWVDVSETTFGPEHDTQDEEIFAFSFSHTEGGFPIIEVIVRNPKIGLLSPGRKVWAWIGWDDGSTDAPYAFFLGKLLGVPTEIDGELTKFTFRARPADWAAQKAALAATLRVPPFWDPVWVTEERRLDPDAVLEARPALWHVDRLTHDVTISDIISGEDGTVDLTDDHFYDGLRIAHKGEPARKIDVEAVIRWNQEAAGEVDLSQSIVNAFRAVGTSESSAISTYTGVGLAEDWPEPGDRIGGGWEVGTSFVTRADGKAFPVEYKQVIVTSSDQTTAPPWTIGVKNSVASFPLWRLFPTFFADYLASRTRTERVTFTLQADVQALLVDADDDDVIQLRLSSSAVGEPVDEATSADPDGELPVFDVRRKAYFPTDRGRISLEYVIAVARAQLLARARAVEITVAVPFAAALDLTCRMNARVEDGRIPGGEATGKIVAIAMGLDGDNGELTADVTIACTIGQGNTVTSDEGDPTWVEDGWVEDGWQMRENRIVMPIAGVVTYEDFNDAQVDDDGVDFFAMTPANVVSAITVEGGVNEQSAVLDAFKQDLSEAVAAVNQVFTEITVELVPVTGGPFETDFPIVVSDLMVPKTIDLESGVTG